jgi:dihydropteroate synthase
MASAERVKFTWRLRTRSLALGERTLVMAILNVTPDSFSGDGLMRFHDGAPCNADLRPALAPAATAKLAIAAAVEALDAGADILDLGAESTRPDAMPLDADEEQDRLLPVIEGILLARPNAILSVDTYKASTARAAARAGAEIVNDVSGLLWDDGMADVVAASGLGVVLMHTRGRPTDWNHLPALRRAAVVPLVFHGLCERLLIAEETGISPQRVVLDPGFGFGKRGTENFALLAGLARLHELGRPLLVGLSRKRFLGESLQPAQRGPATDAAHAAALLAGAHILRVHDVHAALEVIRVIHALHEQRAEKTP